MSQQYAGHGIGFEYPESWTIHEAEESGQISISALSSGTSFWSVHLCKEDQEPATLIETALDAFREEYKDLDVYEAEVNLCQQPTVARDLDFVCLDLVNRAFLRAFRASGSVILILYQGTDFELELTLPDLESISESLVCQAEEERKPRE